MDWLLPAITGLGLGAVLKSFIDFYINKSTSRKKIQYTEMRDAYIGLLDALHKAAIESSATNSKNFALWQTRIQLFGSNDVQEAVQGIIDTNDGPRKDRDKYFNNMIASMRKDLAKDSA